MAQFKISRRDFIAAAGATAASLALDHKKINAYAAKMGPSKAYPVVVIGAGLGGLTCAAYLAGQGVPVTVVEQHDIPGGYATSFDRSNGKFTFEVSLHGTSIHNNQPARILKELGVLDKLELVRLPELYRIKTPTGDVVVPHSDPEKFISDLSMRFPGEAEGIRGFVGELIAIYNETETYGVKSSSYKKITKPIFPLLYRHMWNVRSKTLADLLNEYVQDPKARDLLSFLWGYYGLPPEKLSAFYYAVATGGYLKNGSYYVKNRSQRLSDLLAEAIEHSGGKIIYATWAEKIALNNGAVSGVAISDGTVLPARAVVCNGSALTLCEQMLPKNSLPPDYLARIKSYRPSISSFIVWMGLNQPVKKVVPGYSTSVGFSHSAQKAYELCLKGDIEKAPYSICVYDALFEGYSAPGCSTLMMITLSGHEPWRKFESDYQAGRKEAYNAEKARWTATLIRRAEKDLIPGLGKMIEVTESATPLTNQRFTGNTQGAIYGFEQTLENAFMKRIDNQMPIKGLYLSGAWGNPGGGYAAVLQSGRATFEMLMKSWGA